jgi:hypothetical protein
MIKIIDNFLPEILFKRIKDTLNSSQFKWSRYENIVGNAAKVDPYKTVDGFSSIVDIRNTKETGIFIPLLDYVAEELNVSPHAVMRMYINLTTPQYGWNVGDISYPHIDDADAHTVALLYIDDADGDTYLFDNYGPSMEQKFKVKEVIPPKANKLLLFDGMQFHAGNPPLTRNKRIVINMNFRKQ